LLIQPKCWLTRSIAKREDVAIESLGAALAEASANIVEASANLSFPSSALEVAELPA
jgi:hypothetical protein